MARKDAKAWGKRFLTQHSAFAIVEVNYVHFYYLLARILESRLSARKAVMQAIERYSPSAILVQAGASGYIGTGGKNS
jgi:hypothetical protein